MLLNTNSRYDVMFMSTELNLKRGAIMIPFSNKIHISCKIPSFYEVMGILLPENIFYLVILFTCNEGTLKYINKYCTLLLHYVHVLTGKY